MDPIREPLHPQEPHPPKLGPNKPKRHWLIRLFQSLFGSLLNKTPPRTLQNRVSPTPPNTTPTSTAQTTRNNNVTFITKNISTYVEKTNLPGNITVYVYYPNSPTKPSLISSTNRKEGYMVPGGNSSRIRLEPGCCIEVQHEDPSQKGYHKQHKKLHSFLVSNPKDITKIEIRVDKRNHVTVSGLPPTEMGGP